MIGKESFTLEWLLELRKKVDHRSHPKLLEKVIHAFALCKHLQAKDVEKY